MAIYIISDLHLSLSANKPMDVFKGWENYTERLKANFNRVVKEEDTVILGGDTSWALKLSESVKDFEFLNNLPGKKVLIKGNHDFWWSTANKNDIFLKENNFNKINFIFNNCYVAEDFAICGTRGWFYDCTDESKDGKIINREAARLERSLLCAKEQHKNPIVVLHYPPVYANFVCEPIFNIIKKYNIDTVYYGHIHGKGMNNSVKEYMGVKLKLTSADCIDFMPLRIH